MKKLGKSIRRSWKWLAVIALLLVAIAVGGGYAAGVIPSPMYACVITDHFDADYWVKLTAKELDAITDIEVWNVPWEITDDGVLIIKYNEAEKLEANIISGHYWARYYTCYYWSVYADFPERGRYYLIVTTYRVNGELRNITQWAYSTPDGYWNLCIFKYPPFTTVKYSSNMFTGESSPTYNVWLQAWLRVLKDATPGVEAKMVYLYRDGMLVDEYEPYVGHLATVRVRLADVCPTGTHTYYAEVLYSDGSRVRSQTVTVRVFNDIVVKKIGCLPNQEGSATIEASEPLEGSVLEVEEPPEEYPSVEVEGDTITVKAETAEDVLTTEPPEPSLWTVIRVKLEELWRGFLDWLARLFGGWW